MVCIIITIFSGRLGITDLSIASVGIPAVFAELGIHTGFIVWKAKTENISKFGYDPDNGREVTFGFMAPAEEETQDDNNTVYNNADNGGGFYIAPDRSDKKGVSELREKLLRKRGRFG